MPAPPCLFCLRRIYSNSRAVTCDKCQRCHHIRCGNTGISEEVYDEAVRNQDELRFVCMRCRHYDTSDDDMDVDEVVHVLRVPDAPTDIEATQAALLLHEESGSGDTMDTVGADHSTSMFDVSRPERFMESEAEETDLNDETVHDVVLDGTSTYTVVDGGSKKGSRKLVSSEGYAFVVKSTLVSGVTEWRCSVRGKGAGCPAVIKQTEDAFVKGARGHSHTANPGLLTSVQNAKDIKAAVRGDVFESAPVIVRRVLEPNDQNLPPGARISEQNLCKLANRCRKNMRPTDPVSSIQCHTRAFVRGLGPKKTGAAEPMIAIVVAPLNSIMDDKIQSLRSKNLKGCYLSYDAKEIVTFDDNEDDIEGHSSDKETEEMVLGEVG
ncbi:uncharacterized protein LOC127872412 [Dreissena polymorpha]|uniref:uncharacterized protein LOC127872412 n=1 Tax=Dreissena polymorpha TaxID=45954 RepID=UPI0022649B7C|nr:uncharacterized protein LOC127872412 [Dreissena polymorpha]